MISRASSLPVSRKSSDGEQIQAMGIWIYTEMQVAYRRKAAVKYYFDNLSRYPKVVVQFRCLLFYFCNLDQNGTEFLTTTSCGGQIQAALVVELLGNTTQLYPFSKSS